MSHINACKMIDEFVFMHCSYQIKWSPSWIYAPFENAPARWLRLRYFETSEYI